MPSIWHLPIRHQLTALAGCAALEQAGDAARRQLLQDRIEDSHAALKRLAEHAPGNFAHRVSMIDGELARVDGDVSRAIEALERAVVEAQDGSWIDDLALANELLARCHDDPDEAKRRLRGARTALRRVGATAKARQLSATIVELS